MITTPSSLGGGSMAEEPSLGGMATRRLSAVDAQTYWMSAKIPNDTVLLYGFAGVPADLERALEQIAERARGCPDLTVRVDDDRLLTYPPWVHRDLHRSLFVV